MARPSRSVERRRFLKMPPPAPRRSSARPRSLMANRARISGKPACGRVHDRGVAGARVAAVARNAQSFIRYVRRPAGQMPAYTDKVLSDQELTDFFAFLRSLPAAKAAGDIPLLRSLK